MWMKIGDHVHPVKDLEIESFENPRRIEVIYTQDVGRVSMVYGNAVLVDFEHCTEILPISLLVKIIPAKPCRGDKGE